MPKPSPRSALRRLPLLLCLTILGAVAASVLATGASVAAAAPASTAPGLVTGRVLDARQATADRRGALPAGERLVAGARVEASSAGISVSATTGASGRFSLRLPAALDARSRLAVRVTARGLGTWTETNLSQPLGRDELRLTVELLAQEQSSRYTTGPERRALRTPAPQTGAAPAAPTSSCSGYTSTTTVPSTIRVYMAELGTVQTYDFNYYAKHVLPNEWVTDWAPAALEAGAMAVKSYAWYWIVNGPGGSGSGGCYDVTNTTSFQVFDPAVEYASTDAAVDATWQWVMTRGGGAVLAQYRDSLTGAGEGCGAGANGSIMSQWGSEACAVAGHSWAGILQIYYAGVSIALGGVPAPKATALTWYLNNYNTGGAAQTTFAYGISTDRRVTGDWNGDRKVTAGVLRGNVWYLSDTTHHTAVSLTFGRSGDIPVSGDWNHDGSDGIGVVRGGTWYLDTNIDGRADIVLNYGRAGDTPVTGNWDARGGDGIGVFRSGTWFLRDAVSTGVATRAFAFGTTGDQPVTGNWDSKGSDTIGVLRGATWHLRNANSAGLSSSTFSYGRAGDLAVSGDWNGNGSTSIGVLRG